MAVLGEYHGHLACKHAGKTFDELAQMVSGPYWIGEETSKIRDFSGYSADSRQG